MRKLFSWKFTPSKADFSELWENAVFVFDTNVLLDLYRASRPTAENFLKTLEHIQDRIWLPYQVVNEFLERREGVIDSEAASFKKALSELKKWKSEQQSLKALRDRLNLRGRIAITEVKALFNDQASYFDVIDHAEKALREKIEQLASDHSSLNSNEDYILEKLDSLFNDSKIGESFSEKELKALHKEGEDRYKNLKPPGYMDAKEKDDERKYGDFIIWKETLNFAKKESRPIILITSENKEDWWFKENGEIISPRIELRREFQEYVKQEFWMYRTQRFLEIAGEKLAVEVDPKSIEESKEIADFDFADEQQQKRENLEQATKQAGILNAAIQKALEQGGSYSTFQQVLEQMGFDSRYIPASAIEQATRSLRIAPLYMHPPANQ